MVKEKRTLSGVLFFMPNQAFGSILCGSRKRTYRCKLLQLRQANTFDHTTLEPLAMHFSCGHHGCAL